ncbi:MAG: ABC transporter permease [Planctomycetes bacterium]|nr:ABC transporter permease [Planctomycetota bacterium]
MSAGTGKGSAPRLRYGDLVRRQFRKDRLAMAALRSVIAIVLLAVFAPLIASNRPYVLATARGTSFPLFEALLDRAVYESGIDILFNIVLIASPAIAGIWLAARALARNRWPDVRRWILASIALALAFLFAWESVHPRRTPYRDLRAEIAGLRARGELRFAPMPPIPHAYRETRIEPGHPSAPSARHWLGTDPQGRDVLARILFGTRISLTIGVVAVSIYAAIGIILGALAGFFGGWADILISRLIEGVICFPVLFLILTILALTEVRSVFLIMAVLGLTRWTGVARLVRGEVLRIRHLDYVQAAIAQGIPRPRIIFGHILPNAIAPVLVAATFGIAGAILIESGLAFLGLGDPSAPSWGELLKLGRDQRKAWLILPPGFAIFIVVLLFNLVGEGLRDALDPRLRE